jgi:hypothetical protein
MIATELSFVSEKRLPSASLGDALTVDRVAALQVASGRHWRMVWGDVYHTPPGIIPHRWQPVPDVDVTVRLGKTASGGSSG